MTNPRSLLTRHYVHAALIGVLFTAVIVTVCTLCAVIFSSHGAARWIGKALCDLNLQNGRIVWAFSAGSSNLYPLSVQAITFLAFGMACVLLFYRRGIYRREESALMAQLLPEDERSLIQPADFATVREALAPYKQRLLVVLIERALQQYQTTLSTAEAATIVNASADVFRDELDSNYAVIKYLAWAIPALGFVGTVLGIGRALTGFGDTGSDLPMAFITSNLSTAFDTTFVALMLSLLLMLLIAICQAREEAVVTYSQNYCLANLVNRLFNPENLTR
jgi:biopolymer transport protein ExbB/TolQ